MYYIVAYRESGEVSECPEPFPDLESATYCAALAAYHFGPDYTVLIEGDDDGAEQIIRSADHDATRNSTSNDFAS